MLKLTTDLTETTPVIGAWIGEEGGTSDVHIDVESGAFVIGHNINYSHMQFTPSALCLNKDGTCSYQYTDKVTKECKRRDLPLEYVQRLLLGMLMQVDNAVQGTI